MKVEEKAVEGAGVLVQAVVMVKEVVQVGVQVVMKAAEGTGAVVQEVVMVMGVVQGGWFRWG